MNATLDEVIEEWKNVAEGASVGYICYVSRKTVRKNQERRQKNFQGGGQ